MNWQSSSVNPPAASVKLASRMLIGQVPSRGESWEAVIATITAKATSTTT